MRRIGHDNHLQRFPTHPSLRAGGVVAVASLVLGSCTFVPGSTVETKGTSEQGTVVSTVAFPDLTWSRVSNPALAGTGAQAMNDVVAAAPGLVAVGWHDLDGVQSGIVWTSPDGQAWTREQHGTPRLEGEGCPGSGWSAVTARGPGAVVMGQGWARMGVGEACDSVVVSAMSDGVSWSQVVMRPEYWWASILDVTTGGPGLIAVGTEVLTSPDGLVWTQAPDGQGLAQGSGGQFMFEVTRGGPGFVAVGIHEREDKPSRAAVWTSPDGLAWTRVAHDEEVLGGPGNQGMAAVAVGGPGLVAVGGDEPHPERRMGGQRAAVWTSPDGLTWTRVPHDRAVFGGGDGREMSMAAVTAVGPTLVAVGEVSGEGSSHPVAWSSTDGGTWSLMDLGALSADEEVAGLEAVTSGGPGLVAVGGADSDALVLTAETTGQ